jgi:hypothetical protein
MKYIKSSSHELRDMFENSISVNTISEKLICCSPGDNALEVRERMSIDDFDVLGVYENNQVSGYIEKENLEAGHCKDYQKIFHPPQLIANSTPLIDILPILKENNWIFVLEKNHVTSIVTRADLQKAPVRMLLFGQITLLEMNIQRIIESFYEHDAWQQYIWSERLENARTLFAKRKRRNEAISLLDCIQFCDKICLVVRSPELCEKLSILDKAEKQRVGAIEDLRNRIAHAQDIVTGSSWEEVIDLTEFLGLLLQRCEEVGTFRK